MQSRNLAILLLLALSTPPAAAQERAILVVADVRRIEIERVLNADNLDTSELSAHDVAAAMSRVERGRAPDDFWQAWRTHFAAWRRLADAEARRDRPGSSALDMSEQAVAAQQAIETTFDEVERIARRYGARLPPPAWKHVNSG